MRPASSVRPAGLVAWRVADLPALLDTEHREEARLYVAALTDESNAPEVDYARGYLAARGGDYDSAVAGYSRAQMTVGRNRALAARIALELGDLYISRGAHETAHAVLAWGEGLAGAGAADIAHLRALLANAEGDYRRARVQYRVAIAEMKDAISPFTYAVALTNLAVALAHSDPSESVELARLSLWTVTAAGLHPAITPAARNALGYALICLGDLDGAAHELERAQRGAADAHNRTVEQFANFNLAIVDELRGDASGSRTRLERVRDSAAVTGQHDLHQWAELRLAWLQACGGDLAIASATCERLRVAARSADFENGVAQLQAIVSSMGPGCRDARQVLRRRVAAYALNGDDLNCFVAGLWLAVVEARSGRERAARIALREAVHIGRRRGFTMSPSWWASAAVETARELASPDEIPFVRSLREVGSAQSLFAPTPSVELRCDGTVLVDGSPLDAEAWRAGRTGPKVLRRFLASLAVVYPSGLERDELIDMLWPDSDGDRAVANLYGATRDLRRALSTVPGVDLIVADGRYRLRLGSRVSLMNLPAQHADGVHRSRAFRH